MICESLLSVQSSRVVSLLTLLDAKNSWVYIYIYWSCEKFVWVLFALNWFGEPGLHQALNRDHAQSCPQDGSAPAANRFMMWAYYLFSSCFYYSTLFWVEIAQQKCVCDQIKTAKTEKPQRLSKSKRVLLGISVSLLSIFRIQTLLRRKKALSNQME